MLIMIHILTGLVSILIAFGVCYCIGYLISIRFKFFPKNDIPAALIGLGFIVLLSLAVIVCILIGKSVFSLFGVAS
jgi:hypothetical protein